MHPGRTAYHPDPSHASRHVHHRRRWPLQEGLAVDRQECDNQRDDECEGEDEGDLSAACSWYGAWALQAAAGLPGLKQLWVQCERPHPSKLQGMEEEDGLQLAQTQEIRSMLHRQDMQELVLAVAPPAGTPQQQPHTSGLQVRPGPGQWH